MARELSILLIVIDRPPIGCSAPSLAHLKDLHAYMYNVDWENELKFRKLKNPPNQHGRLK